MSGRLLTPAVLLAFCCTPLLAAVQVEELPAPEAQGGAKLRVKNEYFTLEFVPQGGYASSFQTRYSDREWLWTGTALVDSGHLFLDNWMGENYPGELCFLPREYEVRQAGPELVEIKFTCVTKQKFLLEKTISVRAGSPAVHCVLALTNQGNDTITRGLWPKTDVAISGIKPRTYYYRPYGRGVLVDGWSEEKQGNVGEDFLRTPTEGWTAAIQADQNEGLVWLMDYNWLRTLYNCLSCWTVEWFYDELPFPPGYRWETAYDMILLKGFANLAYASPTLLTGITMEAKKAFDLVNPDNPDRPDLVQVTHTLSRSTLGELTDVTLHAELMEVDTGEVHPLPEVTTGRLTWEPVELVQSVECNPDIRLLCKVQLTATGPDGAPVRESYEYYWPGVGGEKFNLVAGEILATYYRPPPRKVKTFPKPQGIKYTRNFPLRALEFRGPGYAKLRLMEAAARAGVREWVGSYFSFSWAGGKCTKAPVSYEEAYSYDLYVLNGVNAQSLTDFGQEALRDFVAAGGALLMTGGFFSCGAGGYADSPLAEALPVRFSDKLPDLEQMRPPAPVRLGGEARALAGASWLASPLCFWRHRLTPKPEAWVELGAGDLPLLVCGTYGEGRVAILAGTAMGDPQPGETPYWEDPAWLDNMAKLIQWLVLDKR